MKWAQQDNWHWQRDCGNYSISRYLDWQDLKTWHYEAWRREQPPRCLGRGATLEIAYALCARDLREQRELEVQRTLSRQDVSP